MMKGDVAQRKHTCHSCAHKRSPQKKPTKEALDLLKKKMMSGRGKVIRVVGGHHEGCSSWINLNKPKKPPKSYNVILVLDDGTVAEKQVGEINIDFPTQKPPPILYNNSYKIQFA
jgi:hypothetical protein